MTKVTLENFYSNLIAQHEEREMRQKKLEKVMEEEGLKDEEVINIGHPFPLYPLEKLAWKVISCVATVSLGAWRKDFGPSSRANL